MIANDVLRRLRYALDLKDARMLELFALGRATVTPDQLAALLLREDQPGFLDLEDDILDAFLDGLIVAMRGPRDGAPPRAPQRLDNNGILRKLKIALSLREEDMLEVLELAEFPISRGELSALFRQRGHKNYRPCGDQVVRYFLQGLARRLRGPKA